jgi:hypothetical protein
MTKITCFTGYHDVHIVMRTTNKQGERDDDCTEAIGGPRRDSGV